VVSFTLPVEFIEISIFKLHSCFDILVFVDVFDWKIYLEFNKDILLKIKLDLIP